MHPSEWGAWLGVQVGGHRKRANVFVGGKAGEDRVTEALPLRGGCDTQGKAGEGERPRGQQGKCWLHRRTAK